MATAMRRNTSLVKNPARGVTLKGNTASRTKTKLSRNPAKKGVSAKKTVRSRRTYRRNSAASATAGLFAAFGGALVINSFDLLVNKVAPNTSGLIRTVGKFGLGFLVGMYGSKLPLIKGFSPLIRDSLYLAGALDLVGTYVMPRLTDLLSSGMSSVSGMLSTPAVVAVGTTTDATGQMGQAYRLGNGDTVEVFSQPARSYNQQFAY